MQTEATYEMTCFLCKRARIHRTANESLHLNLRLKLIYHFQREILIVSNDYHYIDYVQLH